ncbi:MAG: type III pantothenate kinase [Bacteroidota bacterium]
MNLCIDIGNSRTKIGVFQGTKLLEKVTIPALSETHIHALSEKYRPEAAIWSSVAGTDGLNECFSRVSYPVLELKHDTTLPFTSQYSTPETLGRDRLAAVAGARALYPGTNCLVIDLGTCIKYEVLNQNGVYLGGNIAPGAGMRIKAMNHFTARLPEVEMKIPVSPIGHSTETALQNGALLGVLLEMKGYIELIQATFPGIKVILSGGDAAFFASQPALGNTTVQPDLILHGLNSILNHNQFKDNSTPT